MNRAPMPAFGEQTSRKATALLLATTLGLAACNGPENLANNPDNGLQPAPSYTFETSEPIDPPTDCGPLQGIDNEYVYPSDLSGLKPLPKTTTHEGGEKDEGNSDPRSYPTLTPMLVQNLNYCVATKDIETLAGVQPIRSNQNFIWLCLYPDQPVNKNNPQVVVGLLDQSGDLSNYAIVETGNDLAEDIHSGNLPFKTAKCPFPLRTVKPVSPPTYPNYVP